MAKAKTQYSCQSCGSTSPKWIGKCPHCEQWNTYVEEIVTKSIKNPALGNTATNNKPVLLKEITEKKQPRIIFQNEEFNRVLGGGIVNGSVVLLGGEPGIGKSTLLLQVAKTLNQKVLYVSGEESSEQIKMRSQRLGDSEDSIYFLPEISCENIIIHAKNLLPALIIVDSIQTVRTELIDSSPGTVSQIRESTTLLLQFAKENEIPIILVGHITKDGTIAGPKILEHIVDAVVQFEGDTRFNYRIIRAHKNRFGSTSEIGIFEMTNSGLREVSNPSEFLLSSSDELYSGKVACSAIEGIRPIFIEVQALVSSAVYGTPQRSSNGFEAKRLNMLLAVLEKKIGFKLSAKDVFLNIAGGLKVIDPAVDLAVICAILSSDIDRAIPKDFCFAGEVGLSGEIRPSSRINQRISEAEKLGFSKIFIPCINQPIGKTKIEVIQVNKVEQVFARLFK